MRMSCRIFAAFAFFVLTNAPGFGLEGTKLAVGVETSLIGTSPYGYLAYLPPGYESDPGKKWPVMIFLEGLGEGGPGTVASMTSPDNGIVRHGPMRELWRPNGFQVDDASGAHDYPMIVLSPQVGSAPSYQGITDIYKLDLFISAMQATYRIDPDRVVLTGMSTGGGAALYYTYYQAANARRLAGCLPMVATQNYPTDGSGPAAAGNCALTQLWLLTAFDDTAGGGTVYTAYAWSDAIAQAMLAPRVPSPTNLQSSYPYAASFGASPDHQTARLGGDGIWSWQAGLAGTAGNRRLDGAFRPVETARLMLGVYRDGQHGIWQDAINNSSILNWIITRQRQSPFTGTPLRLPGTIQAENFDRGGAGRGYQELTQSNQGNSTYRARTLPQWTRPAPALRLQYADVLVDDPVEVATRGGAVVVEESAGEWLAFTTEVNVSASYDLGLVAGSASGATVRLLVNGADTSGPIAVPIMAAGGNLATTTVAVTLPAGPALIQLVVDSGSAIIDRLDLTLPVVRRQTIIDNAAARDVAGAWPITATSEGFKGTNWSDLSAIAGSYGPNTLVALPGALTATATYRPNLVLSADYAIEVWYPSIPAANRAAAVPVQVTSTLGTTALVLDQSSGAGGWRRLGTYPCAAGSDTNVVIKGAAAGYALADAVRFSPVPSFLVSATAGTLAGGTVPLSATASFQGSGSGLAYTWSLRSGPPGGTAIFSVNGGGTGLSTATCSLSGTYVFRIEAGFAGEAAWPTASSEVSVAVTVGQPVVRSQTIIDNAAARDVAGAWPITATSEGFKGTNWSDLSVIAGGYGPNTLVALPGALTATATYRPNLALSADYAIEVWYPSIPPANRAAAVPVQVNSTLGTTALVLDQSSGAGGWRRLGTYPCAAGSDTNVVIKGAAVGYALADAVRFSPVPSFTVPAAGSASGASVALTATAAFGGSTDGISYEWSLRAGPSGGSVTFTGLTAGSGAVIATCSRNGTYLFQVRAGFLGDAAWPTVASEVSVGVSGMEDGGAAGGEVVNAVVGWGDSMTNYGTGDWLERAAVALDIPSANMGIPGNTCAQIRARLVADAQLATGSHRAWAAVIWAGQLNTALWTDDPVDRSKPQAYLDDIAAMVAALGHGRYRILQVTPRTYADRSYVLGTRVRNHLDWFNQRLAAIYGPRFIWLLPALQAAANGGADDTADVADGLVPRSLMTDWVHLTSSWAVKPGATTAGNNVVLAQLLQSVPTNAAWDVAPPVGIGSIERETWTGIPGINVAEIPLGSAPSSVTTLTRLEGPSNAGDNYGARIRGYITAPSAGLFTFWLAADEGAELWLSTDDQPGRKVRIANVSGSTEERQWSAQISQKSAPIALSVGIRYYIEVLHKEGAGADHVAVGWAKPGEATTAPSVVIPGTALSPFVPPAPGGAG